MQHGCPLSTHDHAGLAGAACWQAIILESAAAAAAATLSASPRLSSRRRTRPPARPCLQTRRRTLTRLRRLSRTAASPRRPCRLPAEQPLLRRWATAAQIQSAILSLPDFGVPGTACKLLPSIDLPLHCPQPQVRPWPADHNQKVNAKRQYWLSCVPLFLAFLDIKHSLDRMSDDTKILSARQLPVRPTA